MDSNGASGNLHAIEYKVVVLTSYLTIGTSPLLVMGRERRIKAVPRQDVAHPSESVLCHLSWAR